MIQTTRYKSDDFFQRKTETEDDGDDEFIEIEEVREDAAWADEFMAKYGTCFRPIDSTELRKRAKVKVERSDGDAGDEADILGL